jgi:hypothetical protein
VILDDDAHDVVAFAPWGSIASILCGVTGLGTSSGAGGVDCRALALASQAREQLRDAVLEAILAAGCNDLEGAIGHVEDVLAGLHDKQRQR